MSGDGEVKRCVGVGVEAVGRMGVYELGSSGSGRVCGPWCGSYRCGRVHACTDDDRLAAEGRSVCLVRVNIEG